MAYYDENEDQDPNAPQGQIGPESGVITGQGASGATQAAQPKTPDNPGNFVGIQQYLAQNKPQAANLAKDVGSYVEGQGTKAEDALTQGQNQFEQDVDKNSVKLNEDLFNEAKSTPEKVAADEAKKAEFQKMRDATYQGPSSLEASDYYQPINMAIQNALGTAKNTESAQGRTQILTDLAKQKNQQVSRGAANLDNALLGVSPDSRQILSQARDKINPLQDQLKAVTEAENMKAKAAADQTLKTQQMIQQAFSGSNGVQAQLEQSLQKKAADARTLAAQLSEGAYNKLKNADRNISDAELGVLGIDRRQYNAFLNDQEFERKIGNKTPLEDLTFFATRQNPDALISAQNIATPEEYARYAALNELMGTSNGFLSDPTQAGKAVTDALDFNYKDIPSALADRVNTLNFSQRGVNTPLPFNQIYNAYVGRADGPANLAVRIAQTNGKIAKNPNNAADLEDQKNNNAILENAMSTLNQINQAYGVNYQVPQSYVDAAMKSLQDQLSSVYSSWSSPYKKMPSGPEMAQAARTSATLSFLHDLAGGGLEEFESADSSHWNPAAGQRR